MAIMAVEYPSFSSASRKHWGAIILPTQYLSLLVMNFETLKLTEMPTLKRGET